jgi:hypothetical protein
VPTDSPLYVPGDEAFERAQQLLAGYREKGGIVDAPVFDLFDAWVREIDPDAVFVVDALFDTILQDYEPEIDGALITRIPILITQILQRKSIPSPPSHNFHPFRSVFALFFLTKC